MTLYILVYYCNIFNPVQSSVPLDTMFLLSPQYDHDFNKRKYPKLQDQSVISMDFVRHRRWGGQLRGPRAVLPSVRLRAPQSKGPRMGPSTTTNIQSPRRARQRAQVYERGVHSQFFWATHLNPVKHTWANLLISTEIFVFVIEIVLGTI